MHFDHNYGSPVVTWMLTPAFVVLQYLQAILLDIILM